MAPLLLLALVAGGGDAAAQTRQANDGVSSPGKLAILARNNDPDEGASPYVLLDDQGRIQRLVEPSPGMNLEGYVGAKVRIRHDTGKTLLASQLELNELPLQSLAPTRNERGPLRFVSPLKPLSTPRDPNSVRSDRFPKIMPVQLSGDDGKVEPLGDASPAIPDDPDAPIDLDKLMEEEKRSDAPPVVVPNSNRSIEPLPGPATDPIDLDASLPGTIAPDDSVHSDEIISPIKDKLSGNTECNCPQCRAKAQAACGSPECRQDSACPSCGRRAPWWQGCPLLCEPLAMRHLTPGSPIDFGGWTQIGIHSDNTPLSRVDNDARAFNDHPDRLNLHQQWFWIEKKACKRPCGVDWGFRADLLYGTDAVKTQAFGNPSGTWDYENGFDHGGGYGWALPQLYGELAWQDWNVIAGHFYTPAGYEMVAAPENFFYSHSLMMRNSEPFTHCGVLAAYDGLQGVDVYAGWTAGWDTAFESFDGGSNFLGGFKTYLRRNVEFSYITTIGNLGKRSAGGDAYTHTIVLDLGLAPGWNYVLQNDLVTHDDESELSDNNQVGVNQYLFYTINNCWAAGGRFEWWKSNSSSYKQATLGLNYRPTPNLVIRPEVRHDWVDNNAAATKVGFVDKSDYNKTTAAIDAIVTY